jgi:hypothetical protein
MLRDLIRQEWDYQRERPFGRLVRLFVERIFRGGGDADTEGLDLGVGLVLTLLAMPGGFVSLFLLDKYGSFLQWLRGVKGFDALLFAYSDEYFFIVLAMTVTGGVAVWRWDAIFPDRRDYMNLAHLPVSTRTIFFANFLAVLFLVGLLAIDVNAASCVLFPAVVAAAQPKFVFFLRFALVHAVVVVLASIFAFLTVFSILGLLMALLPPSVLRRISSFVRGAVVVYLVSLLCTSFAITDSLRRTKGPAPAWMYFFPSSWFVSLCQTLRGRANPAMAQLAKLCIPGIAILLVVSFCAYAIGYRRHFMRIAETSEGGVSVHVPRHWLWTIYDRLLLRTPFQRGCFRFASKTLLRSEAHQLAMTGIAGLALVLASQALLSAFENAKSLREAALSPEALSIPFILTFLIIIGLRIVFEIPVELRANWIFQSLLDSDRQECHPLARKLILISVLPWILVATFAIYCYIAGWMLAFLHTLLISIWSLLLTNIMLIRFRKLPFTCSLPVFKQHSIVILVAFCFAYLIYAVSTPEFESWALSDPVQMLRLLPVVAVAWYVPYHLRRNTIEIERKLIFEETATRTVEALRLSE